MSDVDGWNLSLPLNFTQGEHRPTSPYLMTYHPPLKYRIFLSDAVNSRMFSYLPPDVRIFVQTHNATQNMHKYGLLKTVLNPKLPKYYREMYLI